MYTKTQISESAVEAIAKNRVLGSLLVNSLRDNANLVITREDIARFKTLPTGVWSVLKDDLAKRRIKWRHIPDDDWRHLDDAGVEVTLEEPLHTERPIPGITDIASYVNTPPVALRSEIRNGSRELQNRDQFWHQCVLPVIESLHPGKRKIQLVDQYAFQDAYRIVHTRDGKFKDGHLLNSGLFWLIDRLNGVSKSLNSTIDFVISASETPELDAGQIKALLEKVQNEIDMRFLSITAHIIYSHEIRRRPAGFIARRLIFNEQAQFQLSHGMRDFSHPRDESSLSGTFIPSCSASIKNAVHLLTKLDQTEWRNRISPTIEEKAKLTDGDSRHG